MFEKTEFQKAVEMQGWIIETWLRYLESKDPRAEYAQRAFAMCVDELKRLLPQEKLQNG